MKNILTTFMVLFLPCISFGQKIIPGDYGSGLKLSYDSTDNMLTGYFESYSGIDEKTNKPQFSCIFYIEGKAAGQKFGIRTYYPADKSADLIEGEIEIVKDKTVTLKLPKEHGGCWNVQHFADNPVAFELEKQADWFQIRYIDIDKAFFYKDKSVDTKMKSYLVKGDFVCIDKVEDEWARCTYYGEKTIKGWIKTEVLNKL
jgi:hypothetical protein